MFKYKGSNQSIITAVEVSNKLLSEGNLYRSIENKVRFDMSTATGEYISKRIKAFRNVPTDVIVYKPWYRWSRAIGYFTPSKPHNINLNYYKQNRPIDSIAATLIHELVHMVDNADAIHSYGHGSNSNKGKANTAPYWIGNMAMGLIGKPGSDYNNIEMSSYKLSLKERLYSFFRRLF